MKKWLFVFIVIFVYSGLFAQKKYALLFSRLPVVTGEEKAIAGNNLAILKAGLQLQKFKPEDIFIDTAAGSRDHFFRRMNSIETRIKKGDFVFVYLDIPVNVDTANDSPVKFIFDPRKPGEFITAEEYKQLQLKIAKKINDPSVFLTLFDSNLPPGINLWADSKNPAGNEGLKTCYLYYVSDKDNINPGTVVKDKGSIFAKAVAAALASVSDYTLTNRSFYKAISAEILTSTTKLFPMLAGNAIDLPLFNGLSESYPAHFNITAVQDNSMIIINGGERINILKGAKVKLYPAYTDTAGKAALASGIVINTTGYSSTVKMESTFLPSMSNSWCYVTENTGTKPRFSVMLNNSFDESGDSRRLFDEIITSLKNSGSAGQIEFVPAGGDLKIKSILRSQPSGNLLLTVINPNSGQVYTELSNIKNTADISALEEYIKRFARFEYISKLKNSIPDLKLEFKLTYADEKTPVYKENGYDVFYDGDVAFFTVINNTANTIYFNVLDLQPDKNVNPIFPNKNIRLYPQDCVIAPYDTFALKNLRLNFLPPFGIERFKFFASMAPLDMENFVNELFGETLGVAKQVNFREINIQDYDFELRSRLYRNERSAVKTRSVKGTVSGSSTGGKLQYEVSNPSAGKIYFNFLKQDSDGNYSLIYPNPSLPEANCFVDAGANAGFHLAENIKPHDQLVTVYADRPFNLADYVTAEKTINSFVVDIIRNGRVSGTPLNKIGLVQELYIGPPSNPSPTSRNGENVFIKMVTPKISTARGAEVVALEPVYNINGFAISKDNGPVKEVKINGDPATYDPDLKFFEKALGLSNGMNKVIIEAIDSTGFAATTILELELKNNTIAASGKGKNYFLGIGIDAYTKWPKLHNARNDVVDFSRLIETRFGFDSSDITLLLDSAATRRNIINRIRYYLTRAAPNDNVIIYLSGHGNEDQLADGDYYFIPQDADSRDVTTAVKSSDIVDNFKKIRAKRCLLIVDACFSGMITNNIQPGNNTISSSEARLTPDNEPGKWIITSGRATKVSDGVPGTNSPFATVLLNYLRENNDENSLKLTRIINFLSEKVPELNQEQHPLGIQIDGRVAEWIFKPSLPGKN